MFIKVTLVRILEGKDISTRTLLNLDNIAKFDEDTLTSKAYVHYKVYNEINETTDEIKETIVDVAEALTVLGLYKKYVKEIKENETKKELIIR